MRRQTGLVAVCGVVIAVLCVAVATADTAVSLAARGPTLSWELPEPNMEPVVLEGFEEASEAELEESPGEPIRLPDFVAVLLQLLVAAAAVALLVLAWNSRPRLRWRRPKPADEFDVLDEVASTLASDVARQRSLLEHGAPRNAIVACWLRLETVIADAGMARRPTDTAQEFTRRVLSQFAVDAGAVDRLAALFREARFSTHEMGEQERAEAIRTLDIIHEGLARAVAQRAGEPSAVAHSVAGQEPETTSVTAS